jgi:hypothetical protein
MRIAILGGRKSGKTAFANALAKALEEAGHGQFKLVDDYVLSLGDRTNLALGHWATYIENLMVATERIAAELEVGAIYPDSNTITVGTIFDTIAYTVLRAEVERDTPRGRLEVARAEATLRAMGMLVADTYDYEYAFFLPYSTSSDAWDNAVTKLIPQVAEQHFQYITVLDGDLDYNVELATKIISELEEQSESSQDQTTEDEQS